MDMESSESSSEESSKDSEESESEEEERKKSRMKGKAKEKRKEVRMRKVHFDVETRKLDEVEELMKKLLGMHVVLYCAPPISVRLQSFRQNLVEWDWDPVDSTGFRRIPLDSTGIRP